MEQHTALMRTSNCNLCYLTSLSRRLICLLVSKSSLIIKKLVFSAFHHLSQAHIYNSKSLQMTAHPPLLIPAKHRVQTKPQAQLQCEILSRKGMRTCSVCTLILHMSTDPYQLKFIPILLILSSHAVGFIFQLKLTSLPRNSC